MKEPHVKSQWKVFGPNTESARYGLLVQVSGAIHEDEIS